MDLKNKAPEEEKDKDKKPVEETAEKPDTKTAEKPASDDKQADEYGESAAAQPKQVSRSAGRAGSSGRGDTRRDQT